MGVWPHWCQAGPWLALCVMWAAIPPRYCHRLSNTLRHMMPRDTAREVRMNLGSAVKQAGRHAGKWANGWAGEQAGRQVRG
ncbi:hypothetical protein V8C86DRAFT_2453108 [Haematococcus lacustris]